MMVQQAPSLAEETQRVVVVELLVLGMLVEESQMFDKLLVNDMLADERVLHEIVVSVEWYRIAEQLVRAAIDTVMYCVENDSCCNLMVCGDN
ncbi:hypothetical protein Tco_1495080 [Tanacetum coccineum]